MFIQYLLERIIRVHHHRSIHDTSRLHQCELWIDFFLSTNHLRSYFFEQSSFEFPTSTIRLSKFTLSVLLLPFLFPLTFATKFPSNTNHHQQQRNFVLWNLSSTKPLWHVGCCIQSNQTMCESSLNLFSSNNTIDRTFPFDDINDWLDYRRAFSSNDYNSNYEFLNNQTLFCQRYALYRHLSKTHLAVFTYTIVIIGLIFNFFVFLVLMCGSLRRSSSFTLFVALTCFDLLSLASSLFGLLIRTEMTYLKTSAAFCKMFGVFFLYFRQCSSTTLLLIAIERCIVIKYHFCRYIFEKFRPLFLVLIMFIYVIPIPFDFVFYTSGPIHCEAFNTLHAHRYQIFRGFFTVFSYAIIPFAGILISNILIIFELKESKRRLTTTSEDRNARHVPNNSPSDNRSTTVMLFVASFAFLILLGPFYIHWCVTYLFHNHRQCRFTRNLYENVQVCMGVFHPHLMVIEKAMRESSHAINFLLYMSTSKRFRLDFQHICRRLVYRTITGVIVFLRKFIWICCTEPAWLIALERRLLESLDEEETSKVQRQNRAAYKTAHYYSNFERRRQNQLFKANLINNTMMTSTSLSPAPSPKMLPDNQSKTARMLTWNPYDLAKQRTSNERQAARLSQHCSSSGDV